MPVPTSISELSTTPGSNSPSGSDSPSVLDDHQRTAYAFIKTLSDEKAAIADAVLLTGAQTVAGVKTFSSTIVGSVNGNAATATTATTAGNVSGTVAIANGGTGQTSAAAAYSAIKQAATETASGAIEIATAAEALAGTDNTRAVTPSGLRSGLGATGSAPIFAARAWVNFAGTTGAIRASGNVSSVTRNGTGDYTVNFATAMADTGYAVVTGGRISAPGYSSVQTDGATAVTSSAFRLSTVAQSSGSPTAVDCDVVSVVVYR